MQQMALEYQAAQRALESVAMTSKHKFITKRMENMSSTRDELAMHVGEEAATRMFCEACCTGETENKAEEKKTT
jgi:hypothetical protein